ncbi:MAG: gamma-glutamyltransferase [Gemmatimonadetes bacterium]|nr:gamma-glutamyltransferase [Gemmatimonadota bacterium]
MKNGALRSRSGIAWLAILFAAVMPVGAHAQAEATTRASLLDFGSVHHPVVARNGMVASQEMRASRVGALILAQGGNAFDAAAATHFALAVSLPRAGPISGGGFMLLHSAEADETLAIDYKETAPAAAHADMFVREDGAVDRDALAFSRRGAGVPGLVAAIDLMLEKYGTMTMAEVIQPALEMARDGIVVTQSLADALSFAREALGAEPAAGEIFFRPDGSTLRAGDELVQRDLAWTLSEIAEHGADAFYRGSIAEKIVADMEARGGLITRDDLAAYRAIERDVLWHDYKGYRLALMPPPGSGGIHIAQMLNVMEHFPVEDLGPGSAAKTQIMVEAMRQAYADRSEYLGDPAFVDVPIEWLMGESYASEIAAAIEPGVARDSENISPGTLPVEEGDDTTHLTVMDKWGNVVSSTTSINFSFGSGIVIPGTGLLLNNVMGDFSASPGTPNAFGLIGGFANSIQPGKRPLSSMSPTIVFRDDTPYLATGSPGGSRIITSVLQVLSNVLDHGMNIQEATVEPRIHHQWLPDLVYVERGVSVDTKHLLRGMGYTLEEGGRTQGSLQSIMWIDGVFYGSSDPRRPGAGVAGY